jgi:hypothetical protein
MNPKLLTAFGALLILIGVTLIILYFVGEKGSLAGAAAALLVGSISLAAGRRKTSW